MVTGTEIQGGILAITRSLDLLQKVKEVAEKTNNVEIKEIIVELRDQLADQKILLVDTKEELANLKSENQKLQEKINKLNSPEYKLIFDKEQQVYFLESDEDKQNGYCPECYRNKNKIIKLDAEIRKSGIAQLTVIYSCRNFSFNHETLVPFFLHHKYSNQESFMRRFFKD